MKRASEIDISKIDTASAEFQNALKLLSFTSQSVFLTGKAGTGKSTFLQYLTRTTKKKFVVLAPTGIAAVNAGGQTIHSFFKLPFKPLLPDDPEFNSSRRLRDRLKYPRHMVKLLKALDLIIIDEVSMVRADTIDFIDRILRVYCGKPYQPFAGKQLLLVGDVFQLEPVITGDMRDVLSYYYKDGAFFFNAKAFAEMSVVPIELRKVFRQNDADFIALLDRIRVGSPTEADIRLLNSRVDRAESLLDDEFTMTIATRRDMVDNINQSGLAKLRTPERRFMGRVEGDFPDSSLPTDKELILKEGAQVVFVKNDPEHRWVNGTIGRVVEIVEDELIVELEDGTRHEVERDGWENVVYGYDEEKKKVTEKVIGTFVQFPVKLAWALTIHKSQGLTFDRVIIDVGQGAFSGGQTYVALSRCRSLSGIKLRSTINARDIFVNMRVVRFSQSFNNDSLINAALENAKADDLYAKAAHAFDSGDYVEAARLFARAVAARNVMDREAPARLLATKMARVAAMQQRITELEREIAAYRESNLRLAREYVDMGHQVREEGWEMQAAVANYDKAISLSPTLAEAWLGKGLALANMQCLDEALDSLAKAADLDAADYRAPYEAGRLLLDSGDLVSAMDMLMKAEARDAKIASVHDALADGYERAGDDALASHHRKVAAKLRKSRNKR